MTGADGPGTHGRGAATAFDAPDTAGATIGPPAWTRWLEATTRAIRDARRWREPRDFDAFGLRGAFAGRSEATVSFASNDYLGLTTHPAVIAAAHEALDRWGAGAGAARLVVGSRPVHSELESALADWKGADSAVLFPTGYSANLGVLTALGDEDTTIVSDAWNHASIVDGCRLSRAEVAVYTHLDYDGARALTIDARDRGRRVLVVSDLVFSMDGDVADVDALADVCAPADAVLVLDEAHAVLSARAVELGQDADAFRDEQHADTAATLHVGTLSKMLGSLGGFVAGPAPFTRLVVNRARPYIFTTASSPADTAAALAALRVLRSPEGDSRRAVLRAHIEILKPGHPSPIVPVLCGSETRAVAAAEALADRGLLVPAIRPPTVPTGTSRLRVALSAAHTEEEVLRLRAALEELGLAC